MTLHQITFTYNLPELGTIDMDMNHTFTEEQKKKLALEQIVEEFPDITDIEITSVKEI